MSGYNLILKIQSLEKQIHELGFRWGYDKHGRWGDGEDFGDKVAIFPRDDKLPPYSRDAMLFCGSIEQLQSWINGIVWARAYDRLLNISNENKREKGEQKHLEYLAKLKKQDEQREMIQVLRASDAENSSKKKVK
jgi:hypothetical protein